MIERLLGLLPRSLFSRLMLIFLVTMASLVLVIHLSLRFMLASAFQRDLGPYLTHYVELVRQELRSEADFDRLATVSGDLRLDMRVEGPGVDWTNNADIPRARGLELSPLPLRDTWVADMGDRAYVVIGEGDFRMVLATQYDPAADTDYVVVLMVGAILLILFICYRSVQLLISPVAWIKTGAERIGKGELDHRIPTTRADELGDLSEAINTMAADIEEMLEAKRQLLLAISHELRSPITRARVSLEFIDDLKVRGPLSEDIREMEDLIDDLLESERLNTHHTKLNCITVSVNDLVRDALYEYFEDAQERLDVMLLEPDAAAYLDPVRIRLLVKNLVGNALRHSSDAGDVIEVALSRDEETIRLRVEDHGEGIAREHLDQITEPFYRVDPSRQRQTGGYGLGLYLCQLIADAHEGKLEVESELGLGTRITVQLPV